MKHTVVISTDEMFKNAMAWLMDDALLDEPTRSVKEFMTQMDLFRNILLNPDVDHSNLIHLFTQEYTGLLLGSYGVAELSQPNIYREVIVLTRDGCSHRIGHEYIRF